MYYDTNFIGFLEFDDDVFLTYADYPSPETVIKMARTLVLIK